MNAGLAFALGIGGGLLLARLLIRPGNCCELVQQAARAKVLDELGPTAAAVGDVLGAWAFVPGALNAFGVTP